MAAIGARFNQTALMRTATVTVEAWDTPPRRMAWTLGMAAIRFGIWLMGFGGFNVTIHNDPGSWRIAKGDES